MALRVDDPQTRYYTRGADVSTSISIRDGTTLVAPDSGTWKLVNASGTVLAGGAVTVTGDIATYAIGSADWAGTESYGGPYTEQWALAFTGYDNRSFDRQVKVVPVLPWWPISSETLKQLRSDILNEAPSADVGWEDKIELAERLTHARLLQAGQEPHEVADWAAFLPYGLTLVDYLICNDLATYERGDGKWATAAADAFQQLDVEWAKLGYAVDADSDRVADATGNLQTKGGGGYLGVPGDGRRW